MTPKIISIYYFSSCGNMYPLNVLQIDRYFVNSLVEGKKIQDPIYLLGGFERLIWIIVPI